MDKSVMARCIGTKQINAYPMTRIDYNILRGWSLPDDENGEDEGYIVEYRDGGAPNHPNFAGYISWSPKDVFERSYQPFSKMTFGHAIELLKEGRRITRAGWNGKGMWLYYVPAAVYKAQTPAARGQFGENVPYRAYIAMKTVDNDVVPWLASQSDVLAEDWMVVED